MKKVGIRTGLKIIETGPGRRPRALKTGIPEIAVLGCRLVQAPKAVQDLATDWIRGAAAPWPSIRIDGPPICRSPTLLKRPTDMPQPAGSRSRSAPSDPNNRITWRPEFRTATRPDATGQPRLDHQFKSRDDQPLARNSFDGPPTD